MSDLKLTIVTPPALKLTVQPPPVIKSTLTVGQGPAGPSGASAPPFVFASAQDTWVINHNMLRRPLVGVFSVGGVEMWGEIIHASLNQVNVYFDNPVAGYAICS